MRQDYIEPDYVHGVKNDDGELVIRPLNDEEKQFLNDYYEEVVGANFVHDSELKRLSKELKEVKVKLEARGDNPDPDDIELLDYLQFQLYSRREEILLYPDEDDHRKLYGENNSRNRCAYNRSKAGGTLVDFDTEQFDERNPSNDYIDPETNRNILFDKYELHKKDED